MTARQYWWAHDHLCLPYSSSFIQYAILNCIHNTTMPPPASPQPPPSPVPITLPYPKLNLKSTPYQDLNLSVTGSHKYAKQVDLRIYGWCKQLMPAEGRWYIYKKKKTPQINITVKCIVKAINKVVGLTWCHQKL